MISMIPFNYKSKKIRVIQGDNQEVWWIAKDICTALTLESVHKVVERLDEDERKLIPVIDSIGRNQDTWVVNETGLYNLIIRSNKPDAKKFKRWITHEVLPSIRKNGKYDINGLSKIDLIIQSAQALKTIESKQIEHDSRLSLLEAQSKQNSGYTGYFTITAWCKFNKIKISLYNAKKNGKEATSVSNEWGVDVGKVTDERFGVVNSYREDVLEEVFGVGNCDIISNIA